MPFENKIKRWHSHKKADILRGIRYKINPLLHFTKYIVNPTLLSMLLPTAIIRSQRPLSRQSPNNPHR